MHTLLYLSGMLLVILLGSVLVLHLLHLFSDWSQRLVMHLLILITPLVSLIVLMGGGTACAGSGVRLECFSLGHDIGHHRSAFNGKHSCRCAWSWVRTARFDGAGHEAARSDRSSGPSGAR